MGEGLLGALLLAQGVMGGLDTLINHELLEGLPHRRSARAEVGLHTVREAFYGVLFIGLAWFAWHGAFAAVLGALLALEVLVMASDEFVENRARVLPQNERVMHVFLTLNYGAIVVLLAFQIAEWRALPTALAPVYYGWITWVLSALGAASAAWSVRDFIAFRRLKG